MAIGIILAGGYSHRAKCNKMALKIQGKPLLHHTIETMKPVVDHIIVVSGHYHQEIKELLKPFDQIELVYNQAYDQGMFESVKCGMRNAKDSVFIQPGDMPFVQPSTYQKLHAAKGQIRIPIYQGKKGHPIYLDSQLKESLLNTNAPHLKAFRDQYHYQTIDVDDPGILIDIDTKESYMNYKEGLKDEN